jgi:dynein heavy chain
LNQPLTQYPDLETLRTDFIPFFDLLDTAYSAMMNLTDYYQSPLINQEYETMEDQVQKWYTTFFKLQKKLNEDFGDASDVAGELKKKIEDFRENLPLIKCIMSEAIHQEDWEEIKTVTGKPELERDTLTVNKFKEEGLMEFLPDIEDITTRAEKKFQLTKKLQELKAKMKEFKMTTFQYKDTFVLKAYDDVNAVLDDQMVAVQAMLGSSYMRGRLKPETKSWEAKLNAMSELVEEIGKCQKVWMQLEPVFASDDIGKTLANETQMFKDVDLLWKTTMQAIVDDPGIIDLVERDNIKGGFEFANKQLDKITKSLNDYLEMKRLVFPRFYFLANEDLLMLLAQTKDPEMVQPHMDKCFEGINRVKFDEKQCVTAMISAEKEIVQFVKPVDVNEGAKKGNVEQWMLEIENVMRKTLQELTKAAIKDFYQSKRTDWV